MPIQRTTVRGKPAYRYGKTGKPYSYTPGNKASRERAKAKARAQGVAIARRQGVQPHL